MVPQAITALKQRQAEISAQIKLLEKEASAIEKALAALAASRGNGAGPVVAEAPAQKKRARKKMSPLGKLKIKLGSLNRYGKKEEAKKVQEKIDALKAKK